MDAVQRIALAAPMSKGGLLGSPADLVDHRVGQLMAWKWSTTTVARPSGVANALP
jgi:hypothetical protein